MFFFGGGGEEGVTLVWGNSVGGGGHMGPPLKNAGEGRSRVTLPYENHSVELSLRR